MSSAGLDHCADATSVTRTRARQPSSFFMASSYCDDWIGRGAKRLREKEFARARGLKKRTARTVLCPCREASDATCDNSERVAQRHVVKPSGAVTHANL